MEQLSRQTNFAELYTQAVQKFDQQRHLMAVGDKGALPKETHAEIASKIDPILAVAIRKYLPNILPYCKTPMDMAIAFCGLILIGEIEDIPKEAVPFIGRGVRIAPFFVEKEPEKVEELLDSVDDKGYPQGEIKDYFFRQQNRFGQLTTCAGILSSIELLRILSENSERNHKMIIENNLLELESTNFRV